MFLRPSSEILNDFKFELKNFVKHGLQFKPVKLFILKHTPFSTIVEKYLGKRIASLFCKKITSGQYILTKGEAGYVLHWFATKNRTDDYLPRFYSNITVEFTENLDIFYISGEILDKWVIWSVDSDPKKDTIELDDVYCFFRNIGKSLL